MNNQWKLVPVEPTETMVINGFESVPNECFTDEEVWEQYQEMSGCQQAAFRAKLCWAAMIGAAPALPEEDAQPVAWANWKVDTRSYVPYRTKEEAQRSVEASEISATQLGPYRVVPLFSHPGAGNLAEHCHLQRAKLAESNVERLTAERDALQERLTTADQRIDDLETQLASTEQSRRAWFDSSQAADKRIDGLTGASSRAAADIVAERQRQITAEGYKPDRDDCYSFGELALAAAGYAASAGGARSIGRQLFRWDDVHWKPSTPRRDLVKSGALILAEIERIDRAAITNTPQ
ncbi:hypothetical protein [Pseudomonas sp. PDM04]|uniref:hypothetical protein n=1 Tax=Pseudomonas sp. PDM04 TaxID=2769296 RepID=UPI00177E22FB|nr:hypothetical protein [Pseudomonas sp. PDM04]MBD9443054.1 hypothetical protein [Pseudomonas sp. PDM04]